jgi:hypothetical protein
MTIHKKDNAFTHHANSFESSDAPSVSGTASGAHVHDTSGGCLIPG